MKRFSLLTLCIALWLTLTYLLGLSHPVDNLFLDTFLNLRGQQTAPEDIIIVALDEDFISAYGTRVGDVDRRVYAEVITTLKQTGARVIGLDFFFPEVRAEDAALAEAIAAPGAPVVLPQVAARLVTAGERTSSSTRTFLKDEHLPFNPLLQDVPRGVLGLAEYARMVEPLATFQDGRLPSFALQIVQQAGLEPNTRQLSERLIDYRGPAGSFVTRSFLDVRAQRISFSEFQNKIVLVGVTLLGTDRDQILTPFGDMPGVEVNANEVFTLLHGRLVRLSDPLYALFLLALGVSWPFVSKRRWGIAYTLVAALGVLGVSYVLFLQHLFVSPFMLIVTLALMYMSSSYESLASLDKELLSKLSVLLDSAQRGAFDVASTNLTRGFSPVTTTDDGDDMLESLMSALNGLGGVLLLQDSQYQQGEVSETLSSLAMSALHEGKKQQTGTLPHHLAEPIFVDGQQTGVIAMTLPAPLPPHLRTLFSSSLRTFSQLAHYQRVRARTTTISTRLPQRTRSSQDKIQAISMVSDLLATERSWLGVLLETLPQAVFIMSPYGYIIYKNVAARRLFGDEKNMLSAIPKNLKLNAETFQKDYIHTVEQGETLELGVTERRNERPVLLTLQVVRANNEVKGVAGIVSDLGAIEEVNRQRQEMFSMIVHDLRTPLTGIRGFADLLLELSDDETMQEYLGIISEESERMKRMTDDVLDLSKLESDTVALSLADCNVAELLRHAVASLSPEASRKDITIAVLAPTFVGMVADADLLSRVLLNLLSNAVKYSPAETRVTATLAVQDAHVRIVVKDEGFGLSEEQQRLLFRKYGRVSDGPHAAVKGTGLGLYLVKMIVEAHQGSISVTSQPEVGTSFVIELPVAPDN